VFAFVKVIGESDSTVLITGESGTSKEVIATLIHQTSRRKRHPFVAISCALFSETLIESRTFVTVDLYGLPVQRMFATIRNRSMLVIIPTGSLPWITKRR
jgi:transcriptional regulator of acetoin/glycerol metabolism